MSRYEGADAKRLASLAKEFAEMPLHDPGRFERQVGSGASMPIFVLQAPSRDKGQRGILLCGDEILPDLLQAHPRLRKDWFVIGTTQSDIVPKFAGPDLWLFSNPDRKQEYLASPAGDTPFLDDLADGHFIDSDLFHPDPSVAKDRDFLYIAKSVPSKRTELLVEAAGHMPETNVTIVTFDYPSPRKLAISREYGEIIRRRAANHPNVDIVQLDESRHPNPDGSSVIGALTKPEMRRIFNGARATGLFADRNEAVNRAICEGMCCGLPIVVTSDTSGMAPHMVTHHSGLLVPAEPEAIANGIQSVLDNAGNLAPRDSYLSRYGQVNSMERLRGKIAEVAGQTGENLDLSDMRVYSGDLWTHDYYREVQPTVN